MSPLDNIGDIADVDDKKTEARIIKLLLREFDEVEDVCELGAPTIERIRERQRELARYL